MAPLRAVLAGLVLLLACAVVGHSGRTVPDASSRIVRDPVLPLPSQAALRLPDADRHDPPTTLSPHVRPVRASRATVRPRPAPAVVYAEIDGMPGLLRRIGGCESAGHPDAPINWGAQNRHSTASGGFQILDSTWAGWVRAYAPDLIGLYAKARNAPPADQLRVALAAFHRQGTGPWKASRGCWN